MWGEPPEPRPARRPNFGPGPRKAGVHPRWTGVRANGCGKLLANEGSQAEYASTLGLSVCIMGWAIRSNERGLETDLPLAFFLC